MTTDIKNRELILCQDKEDLADKAAKSFCKIANEILAKKGVLNLALSGGSTPKLIYERLLKDDLVKSIDWGRIAFFVSDERCVPHSSSDSNWGNASRQLLQPLNITSAMLHPTEEQDTNPDDCAEKYEEHIRNLVKPGNNGLPCFDIIFLGMGPDGHTASLFPGSKGVEEKSKLVIKNHVEKLSADRISFTFPLINSASNVIFLVAGEDKSEVLAEVMANSGKYPCEHVNTPNGKVSWFVDRFAACHMSL